MSRLVFASWLVVFLLILHDSTGIASEPRTLRWRKHTINDRSPFEAAGVGDFNNDGRLDVFSGDSWYEAPSWKRHQVRTLPKSPNPHYEEDFADLPVDVNRDGRLDIITCAYFGKRVGWVEQPADPTKPWIEHAVDHPGPMETGRLVDLNQDGQLDFLPNCVRKVVWYELQAGSTPSWKTHDLGKEGGGHGVGVGDVDRDGRTDILTAKGWYRQPEDAAGPWTFHPEFELGAAGIHIIGRDFDGDGDTDVLWGMGHDYGLFWLVQSTKPDGTRVWRKERVDTTFSQVHTLELADFDGDGQPEVVTGKRVYAHESEPGATDAPCVYSFRYDRDAGRWMKSVIYEGRPAIDAPDNAKERWALNDFERGSAGTGLHVEPRDMDGDGDVDLVCPGKSGLYWFENLRLPSARPASQ